MKDAINNNPVVQICLVAVLLVIGGVMLAPQLLHKKDSGASAGRPRPPPAPSSRPRRARSTSLQRSRARRAFPGRRSDRDPVDGRRPSTGTSTRARWSPPGPPPAVVTAWHRGDTIVLLIVREGGVDDRLVRQSVEALADPADRRPVGHRVARSDPSPAPAATGRCHRGGGANPYLRQSAVRRGTHHSAFGSPRPCAALGRPRVPAQRNRCRKRDVRPGRSDRLHLVERTARSG